MKTNLFPRGFIIAGVMTVLISLWSCDNSQIPGNESGQSSSLLEGPEDITAPGPCTNCTGEQVTLNSSAGWNYAFSFSLTAKTDANNPINVYDAIWTGGEEYTGYWVNSLTEEIDYIKHTITASQTGGPTPPDDFTYEWSFYQNNSVVTFFNISGQTSRICNYKTSPYFTPLQASSIFYYPSIQVTIRTGNEYCTYRGFLHINSETLRPE